ncbi:hypothetical protein SAMN04244560_02064 [Thermoanaerobacter thermohydrosulfuricus]|uniref:Copper amine oxidase N-terminal domain-containing protein n=1 Tax=Thermoanaerobacter thermohydrosulfuricus TaxID=1516 RepID=A0A1G7SX00_THETY|nr:hypothetical protein [Thermoanaerobacter thermohydrosulfuricus]SDG27607.1 hypothetical protein SAMN04244560_02064 [Thermoanaerobacter thermohydrosulfuricus]
MIFNINKLIIKILVFAVVLFFVLSFIKTGQKYELQQNLNFPQKMEYTQHDSKWLKDYKYVDYKITTTFRKEPYDFKLIEAKGQHSLIKVSDLAKMLYGEYAVSGDFITITVYNTSIKLKLNDPHLWGYTLVDGVKKRALYKIPYPPIEVDGEIYVPVRSVLRAFNMGVVFAGDKIFVGYDVPRNDTSLIFEKFVEGEE